MSTVSPYLSFISSDCLLNPLSGVIFSDFAPVTRQIWTLPKSMCSAFWAINSRREKTGIFSSDNVFESAREAVYKTRVLNHTQQCKSQLNPKWRNDSDVTKTAHGGAVVRGILNSRRIRLSFHRSIMGRLSGWCSTEVRKTFPSQPAPSPTFSRSLSLSFSLSERRFQGSNLLLLAQALPDNETKGTEYDIVVQRPVGKGSYCRSLWILKSTIDTARGMRL